MDFVPHRVPDSFNAADRRSVVPVAKRIDYADPLATLDFVHDGPRDRRARSKPSELTPGHSGQPGRSAQAGQIQHASHSRHRQVR